jgi:hypothetical protein
VTGVAAFIAADGQEIGHRPPKIYGVVVVLFRPNPHVEARNQSRSGGSVKLHASEIETCAPFLRAIVVEC